jgi:hypothetical protein
MNFLRNWDSYSSDNNEFFCREIHDADNENSCGKEIAIIGRNIMILSNVDNTTIPPQWKVFARPDNIDAAKELCDTVLEKMGYEFVKTFNVDFLIDDEDYMGNSRPNEDSVIVQAIDENEAESIVWSSMRGNFYREDDCKEITYIYEMGN